MIARGWQDGDGDGVLMGERVGVSATAVEMYAAQQPAIKDDGIWSLSWPPEWMVRYGSLAAPQ